MKRYAVIYLGSIDYLGEKIYFAECNIRDLLENLNSVYNTKFTYVNDLVNEMLTRNIAVCVSQFQSEIGENDYLEVT